MKTPNTSSMLIARRLAYTIAALAMLIWTCNPAQADFDGTLQGNQLWTVELNNSGNVDAAGAAIYSIDRMGKVEYFQVVTVPGGQSPTLTVTRVPRGTVRVIIEVDPRTTEFTVFVRLIQGGKRVWAQYPGELPNGVRRHLIAISAEPRRERALILCAGSGYPKGVRPSARLSSQENKAIRRLACSYLNVEPLLTGTGFREPHPATSAADLDVITLCSRSRP